MPRCARCFGEVQELAVFCSGCGQPHAPAFDQLLNHVIGERYQIYRRLDKGGPSAVFTAIDLPTDQIVVVKISNPSQLAKRELTYALAAEEARRYWAEMLERMRREAEALTPIRHPHIVRLYDTGTLNADLRFVVMEYLRGRTLREELGARQKLPLNEALQIAIALADALYEIHSRGIVHRDLNPRNVMLCGEGRTSTERPAIKLIDFGIAKFPQPPGAPPFTQHSILSGTVAYASPEQCQNQPLDQRTDLYSLGIVLYEMVTGERPFSGRTPTEIALKQIQAQPKPPRELVPELPLSLETTILRALAKDPAERHAHIGELGDELRAIAQRFVIALPERSVAASLPLIFNATAQSGPTQQADRTSFAAASTENPEIVPAEELEYPIFTAYQPTTSSKRRQLAYAAALLLFLGGAAFLAKNRVSKSLPAFSRNLALHSPLATPTATPLLPLLIDQESAMSKEAASLTEPILPAPEAEMAQAHAAFSMPRFWNRVKTFAKPQRARLQTAKLLGPKMTQPATATVIPPPALPEPQVVSLPEPAHGPAKPDLAESISAPEKPRVEPENRPRRQREPALPNPSYETIASINPEEGPSATAPMRDEWPDSDRAFSPRVIAWSGAVSGERVIRLEMPGVPGRIEIPRSYRHRVGIVESPNLGNRWRLAVLRIFGSGECSIILRWWPRGR